MEEKNIFFKVEEDGSFAVYYRRNPVFQNCYPGINNRALRTKQLKVSEDQTEIEMETVFGTVGLELKESEGGITIGGSIRNCRGVIESFSPLFQAKAKEAEGIFRVSGETGGDTGFYTVDRLKNGEITSEGICAVRFPDITAVCYFTDFRRFRTDFRVSWEEEGIRITPEILVEGIWEEQMVFPAFHLKCTDGMRKGLDYAASEIAREMAVSLDKPESYNWCSWYYCYHNFDENQLAEYLEEFQKTEGTGHIRYFLLDAGYCTSLGDWLSENENWKNGLEAAVRKIREYGYRPALWIGPYMVGNRSRLFLEHPDWILYDPDGKPVITRITDNEPKLWNYQDEEYYTLDISHPDAMEYMRGVFRTFCSYGVQMFKTDFMLWGMQDSRKVRRYCPGKTSVEYFRDFLKMIREEAGEETYLLGCIAPFFPFLGYADGMRTGDDVGSRWSGSFGPVNMINATEGCCFMNHVFWENDPDVVMLRDFQIRLNAEEIKGLALYQAMAGGSIYTSDPLHRIAKERKELFRFIRPNGKRRAEQPFLGKPGEEKMLVQKSRDGRKALVFLLNPGGDILQRGYEFNETGLEETRGCHWNISAVCGNGICQRKGGSGFFVFLEPHGHLLLLFDSCGETEKCTEKSNLWDYLV